MTKTEFIRTLREKLMGEVSTAEIENMTRYYEDYIEDAVKNGRSEEEVLAELGSPLLIARTIIDTAAETPHDEQSTFQQASQTEKQQGQKGFRQYDMNSLGNRIILAVIVIVALVLVFSILRMLIPIVLPLLIIWLIVRMVRRGGNG